MSIQEVQPFLPPNILDTIMNTGFLFAFIGFMNISTLITDGEIVLSNDYELNVPYYSDGRKILNL